MRPLESLLTLLCLALLVCGGTRSPQLRLHVIEPAAHDASRAAQPARSSAALLIALRAAVALIFILQILIEGWRVQMLPAYVAVLILLACAALPAPAPLSACASIACAALARASTAVYVAIAALGLLSASIAACLALPYVPWRAPDGPFAVGLRHQGVVLPARTGSDAEVPELAATPEVTLYYPVAGKPRAPSVAAWWHTRLQARLAAQRRLPVTEGAPIAAVPSPFPVVLYFGGWPENRLHNVNLVTQLASRGFVVAALEYPFRPAGRSDRVREVSSAQLARPISDYSSEAAFRHSVESNDRRARRHAQDAVAVLDLLAQLNTEPDGGFFQRLDVDRTGVIGFSFGGAVAAEATRLDPRIRAAVNLDGRHWADGLSLGVACPYLFIGEELLTPTTEQLQSADPMTRYEAALDAVDYSQLAAHLRAHGGIQITLPGTAHSNFSDDALRSPLGRLSGAGHADARSVQTLVGAYVTEFFRRYLQSPQPPPIDTPLPTLPGARIQAWSGNKT